MNQMMNRISRNKKERDKLAELMLNNETGNDMLNERVKKLSASHREIFGRIETPEPEAPELMNIFSL